MMSIDDVLKKHAERKVVDDGKKIFHFCCLYGACANTRSVYLPPEEPQNEEELSAIKATYKRYKPELGWYSSFPEEGAIALDLTPFLFKETNGYYAIDRSAVQRKVAEIRSAKVTDGGRYVGAFKERMRLEVTLERMYTVRSKSDFGDFLNLVFVTDGEQKATVEWLQRNYSEDTVKLFFRKSKKAVLIGTVSRQYTKFGKKYTRVKNCDVYNERGVSLHDFAAALRSRRADNNEMKEAANG